jgi:hypothetical protein
VSAYRRGDEAEKAVLALFVAEGYIAWQARGSKGVADLICVKPGQVVLVQVKSAHQAMRHDGWNGLLDVSLITQAVPVVADFPEWRAGNRGPVRLRRITGRHTRYNQTWLAEPFVLDQVAEGAPVIRAFSERK